MLTALILICSVSVTPDIRDCTRDNASDVMQGWARAQSTDPVYLGVLYRAEGEASFEDHIQSSHSGTEKDAPQVIESILERYS